MNTFFPRMLKMCTNARKKTALHLDRLLTDIKFMHFAYRHKTSCREVTCRMCLKLHSLGLSGTRTKCWLVNVLPSGCLGWRGSRASMYVHNRCISTFWHSNITTDLTRQVRITDVTRVQSHCIHELEKQQMTTTELLVGWCLMALSAQIGYIVPSALSYLTWLTFPRRRVTA